MKNSVVSAVVFAGLVSGTSFFTRDAFAYSFANCSTTTWTEVPVRLGPDDLDRDQRPPYYANYANAKDFSWRLLFNPNVNLVGLQINNWNIEMNFDSMALFDRFSTNIFTGFIPSGWTSNSYLTLPTIGAQRAASYFDFSWYTDYSDTYKSPLIDKVRVKCSGNWPTNNTTPALANNKRYEGILIATGDVLYFSTVQKAGQRLIISLDHLSTQVSADFDLFASSNISTPDGANYQWKSDTTSGSESIRIDYPTNDRTIYFAVYSYSGNGHFAIHANAQWLTAPTDLRACTPSFSIPPADQPFLTNLLKEASLRFHSATQGHMWFNSWTFSNEPCTDACHMCLESVDNTECNMHGNGTSCRRVSNVKPCVWKNSGNRSFQILARGVAHEYGHTCFLMADEYQDIYGAPSFCGHSLMSTNPVKDTTGLVNNQFCTSRDHCLDPEVASPQCALLANQWSYIIPHPYIINPPAAGKTPYSTYFVRNQSLRDKITVTY